MKKAGWCKHQVDVVWVTTYSCLPREARTLLQTSVELRTAESEGYGYDWCKGWRFELELPESLRENPQIMTKKPPIRGVIPWTMSISPTERAPFTPLLKGGLLHYSLTGIGALADVGKEEGEENRKEEDREGLKGWLPPAPSRSCRPAAGRSFFSSFSCFFTWERGARVESVNYFSTFFFFFEAKLFLHLTSK